MSDSLFGKRQARREDVRLATGRGRYTDDIGCPGAAYAVFVRSLHASARILSIGTDAAAAMPGVRAIFTAADLDAAGVADYVLPVAVEGPDGASHRQTPRPLLARDLARFAGEPVAMVLADSATAATDAAEAVDVDYEPLDAVADLDAAAAPAAPQVWPDRPGNVAYRWSKGDAAAVEAAMEGAAHVTTLSSSVSRIAGSALEPRAALAYPDDGGRTVIHLSHQNPHQFRDALCAQFALEPGTVRVVIDDVGGSFGIKSGLLREEALVFWASRMTSSAVRWTSGRSESLVADEHGRDVRFNARLGFDENGRILALDVRTDSNIGAYFSNRSLSAFRNIGGISGVYDIPLTYGHITAYFTHTQTIGAYRGAGRPEATYVIERLIDLAAAEMGMDAADLRRRNLIGPDQMPYATAFVLNYDCGDFPRVMDRALELSDYEGFESRRDRSRAAGRLRGIGLANPIEVASGPVQKPGADHARIELLTDGSVRLYSGAMSVGQGLDTALSALTADRLSVPFERVTYIQGDTDVVAKGKGSGGSAALTVCGSAIELAAADLIRAGAALAAGRLDVPLDSIRFEDGMYRAAGSNRSLGLGELAALAGQDGSEIALSGDATFQPSSATYPNGCHVAEVEIDPGTGRFTIEAYTSVEDIGRVMNPLLVEGQLRGGAAQAFGQVMLEQVRFSAEGQLQTGSFMDYGMPRATDLPNIVADFVEVPTALNPLGVKGVGEAGTVGALAATMNAICNALAPCGIHHIEMPATPDRIWRAIAEAACDASS